MIQQAIALQTRRFFNFVNFAKHFLRRQNFVASIQQAVISVFKDIFTVRKKLKMAQYRVNYQQYQLRKWEQVIAENNEHVFLKGNRLNELR